jgi:hypothetical protein
MLDVWLIPALVLLAAVVAILYVVVRAKGGSGVRTEGRRMVDKPMPEEDLPPG